MRGDDRAGLLECGELQRDRRADDRVLPLVGNAEPPDPFLPVRARALLEFATGAFEVAFERRVGADDHGDRARQHERGFAVDVGERRVGGQTDRLATGIADVIAAERALHVGLAVARGRTEADGDARQAGDRLDDAHQLRRAVRAAELLEARREVRDAHRSAVAIGEHGGDQRGVAHVFGMRRDQPVENDVGEALLLIAGEQPAEHGIAIETREAPPHNAAERIDQRDCAAVSDDGKIKVLLRGGDIDLRANVHRFS